MNKYLSVILIASIIAIASVVYLNNKTRMQAPRAVEEIANKQGIPVEKKGISHYVDYSEDNLLDASARSERPVLFFAALAWCPSCQAADKDFKANLDKLPKDVTVLIVNYDTEKELKSKYAITMQDTFVQVDNKGQEIARWNGGGRGIDSLLANIK